MALSEHTKETAEQRRERLKEEREKEKLKNLEWIVNATYSHLWNRIEERWANPYRTKTVLAFTESGKCRLVSIFGWIVGLHQTGQTELACKLADDIVSRLDYLADYGGTTTHCPTCRPDYEVANYRIELADDGTFAGFSLLFCPRVDDDYVGDVINALTHESYGRKFRYRGGWPGGLLYHGPACGETFSVSLSSCLWGIHT